MSFGGFIQANTQVIVIIGPFVDVGDGFTPETGITLGAADEAELLKHGSSTVVDISAATWAAVSNCDGYYSLTLTTSHTDTEGLLTIVVQDDSVCLPVHMTFQVIAQSAWSSLITGKDTGYMDVNVKAVGDTTQTANDMSGDVDTILSRVVGTIATGTHNPQGGDAYAIVNNGTYGNSAIKTLIDGVEGHVSTIDGHITADYTATEKAAIDLLDDVDGGLGDIHTVVNGVETHVHTIDGHITADYTTTEKAAIDLLDDVKGLIDVHDTLDLVHTDVDTLITRVVGTILAGSHAPQSGDSYSLANGASGFVATKTVVDDIHTTDLPAVKGDTAAILQDTGTDGVVLKAAGLNADAVDEILDEVVEGTTTLREAIRLVLSVLTGISSGGGTSTLVFKDIGNTKTRLSVTVDSNGNRTNVGTRDGS